MSIYKNMKNKQIQLSIFYWLLWTGVILFLLATRFIVLGEKTLHHDESLFCYYARYIVIGLGYFYQPILHGPLLLEATALMLSLFGESVFVLRFVPVITGIGLIFVVFTLRDKLGYGGALCAAFLIAVSPTLMYYSRFLRNDTPFAFMTLLTVWAIVRFWNVPSGRRIVCVLLALTGLVCIKENSLIFLSTIFFFFIISVVTDIGMKVGESARDLKALAERAMNNFRPFAVNDLWISVQSLCVTIGLALILWFGYTWTLGKEFGYGTLICSFFLLCICGLYYLVYFSFRSEREQIGKEGILRSLVTALRDVRWELLGGIMLSLSLIVFLFSTFLTYPQDLFSLFRDTFKYWWGQHSLHRIKGPFHFYLSLLLIYELPLMIIVTAGFLATLFRRLTRLRIFLILWLLGFLVIRMMFSLYPPDQISVQWWMDKVLHMTSPFHVYLAFTLFLIGVFLTVIHFIEGRKMLAFLGCWFYMSILAYSYAGEKVPWVTVHIALPGILFAAMYVGETWKSARSIVVRIVLVFLLAPLILFNARSSIVLCFLNPEHPREQMVYNHTSPDLKEIADDIRHISEELGEGLEMKMYIADEAIWPLRWYLRDFGHLEDKPDILEDKPPVIVLEFNDLSKLKGIKEHYSLIEKNIRVGWYAPSVDFRALTCGWLWRMRKDADPADSEIVKSEAREMRYYIVNYMLHKKPYEDEGRLQRELLPTICFYGVRKDLLNASGLFIGEQSSQNHSNL